MGHRPHLSPLVLPFAKPSAKPITLIAWVATDLPTMKGWEAELV